MTQKKDLIQKMAEFFTSEDFFERGEDARLELSPDDVRCMNEIIKACSNAIDRAEAIKIASGYCHFSNIPKELAKLPPVTPEPKTGHWIEENINGGSRKVFCSECGCPPPFEYISSGDVYSASGYGVINKTKYCPNCGIKMQEAEESDHKCHTCKHYTKGDYDGSCGSYICKGYSDWESEDMG